MGEVGPRGYPYLARHWQTLGGERSPLTILVQNREQTEELLLAVDPANGATTQAASRKPTPPGSISTQSMPHWLDDGKSFLWTTERSGELATRTARTRRQLAPSADRAGRSDYRDFVGVDEEHDVAYVIGGDDPTQSQLFASSIDDRGSAAEQLTKGGGVHSAKFAEHGGTRAVIVTQPLEGEIRHDVYRGDGSLAGEFKSVAEKPPFEPTSN